MTLFRHGSEILGPNPPEPVGQFPSSWGEPLRWSMSHWGLGGFWIEAFVFVEEYTGWHRAFVQAPSPCSPPETISMVVHRSSVCLMSLC